MPVKKGNVLTKISYGFCLNVIYIFLNAFAKTTKKNQQRVHVEPWSSILLLTCAAFSDPGHDTDTSCIPI